MSIQHHLNQIRNAIYGREVRESIAKGIETAYDDASENDNANMEVKIARGTHPNLRSRLDEMSESRLVLSKTTPNDATFWFEDRGDSGLDVSTGSGISIMNAEVSDDEIDDKGKLWFDK